MTKNFEARTEMGQIVGKSRRSVGFVASPRADESSPHPEAAKCKKSNFPPKFRFQAATQVFLEAWFLCRPIILIDFKTTKQQTTTTTTTPPLSDQKSAEWQSHKKHSFFPLKSFFDLFSEFIKRRSNDFFEHRGEARLTYYNGASTSSDVC